MSQAQITALKTHKKEFKSIKEHILYLIKEKDRTEYQLKAILNIKRATIIARLSELQDSGQVYVSKTFNKGLNSVFSYETNELKQKLNAMRRAEDRYNKWLKLGKEKAYFEMLQFGGNITINYL